MICALEHPPDAGKLILCEKFAAEDISGELDSDLPYVLRLATALLPYVLQCLTAYQNQFIITDFLHAVPHNTTDPSAVLYEIQFELLMLMQRVCELRLVTLDIWKQSFSESGVISVKTLLMVYIFGKYTIFSTYDTILTSL